MKEHALKFTLEAEEAIENALGSSVYELGDGLTNRKNLLVIAKQGLIGAGMAEAAAEKNAANVTRKEILDAIWRDMAGSDRTTGDELSK